MQVNIKNLSVTKTAFYTSVALVAFAANSVLCRMALADEAIDAASFTVLRLLSGVVVLMLLLFLTRIRSMPLNQQSGSSKQPSAIVSRGSWLSACMLFLYAATFSFAYVSLDTGVGALVLFGAVQITMIIMSMYSGHRLRAAEWLGLLLAFAGFVYLVQPSLSTPSLAGFLLMAVAGIGWGVYSMRGKAVAAPLADSAFNFARTLPFVLILALLALPNIHLSSEGVVLAVLSGGLASGLGYALWYAALAGLSAPLAAVVQLLVPVIAAIGGVVFMAELVTMRLMLSGAMILLGVLVVLLARYAADR